MELNAETEKTIDLQSHAGESPHAGLPVSSPKLQAILTEPYKGQGMIASIFSRAAILGGIGFGVGTFIGDTGDRPRSDPKYKGMSARFWQIILGGGLAVLGASMAMREARDAEFQHARLQKAFKKLYASHVNLQAEMDKKNQEAQAAPAIRAEMPEPDVQPDAPQTTVLAADAVLEGAKTAAALHAR